MCSRSEFFPENAVEYFRPKTATRSLFERRVWCGSNCSAMRWRRSDYVDPTTGEILQSMEAVNIYPAKHFVTSTPPKDRLDTAIKAIRSELHERLDFLNSEGKLLEAQRLEQRTKYDLEMLGQVGYCNGVENYARHLAGRQEGTPPECLIDYFPDDWLLIVDESHVTCSQLQAMYNGDQARKKVLIEHGFRLPSAADNRPLKGEEFWDKAKQTVFVSATPGNWEMEVSGGQVAEQVIRPTGVLDPIVEVRPTTGQVDDLLGEIRDRAAKQQRVLVTTLTKRMAEDLTDYLAENEVRVRYLHSEIHSIERIEIIQDLRLGEYDVLVGVNLCGKAWTCRRCRWWRSSMPVRRAFCGRSARFRPSVGRPATSRVWRCSTPTT